MASAATPEDLASPSPVEIVVTSANPQVDGTSADSATPASDASPNDAGVKGAAATEAKPADDANEYTRLSPLVFRLVFGCLCLMCFMAGLDITIVVTAMPYIAEQLNCLNDISWVITAFLLAQTAVCPLVGRLSEIYGRKFMLLFAVGTFTVFSIGCALSNSIEQLAVLRAFQGIGGGAIMSSVLIVITDITPARTRGMAIAPIGIMFALASIVGPLLGGALTGVSHDGWRYCFWINLPIGASVFLALSLLVPSTIGDHHKRAAAAEAAANPSAAPLAAVTLDVVGSVSCVIFVVALTLALTWGGGDYAWSDAHVITLLVVAGVFSVLFLLWEVRHRDELCTAAISRSDVLYCAPCANIQSVMVRVLPRFYPPPLSLSLSFSLSLSSSPGARCTSPHHPCEAVCDSKLLRGQLAELLERLWHDGVNRLSPRVL